MVSMPERFMRVALSEAAIAAREGEIPVGAVLARGDTIVAQTHNARERLNDPTAHAEILAIRRAAKADWRLTGMTIYVNGTQVTSGSASAAITLGAGTTTIFVMVVESDAKTAPIYQIDVTKGTVASPT